MSTQPVSSQLVPYSAAPVAAQEFTPDSFTPDLVALLLDDKRSPQTQRAYAADLRAFFLAATGQEPTPDLVTAFLKQETPALALCLACYKSGMRGGGLAEATINRRLAAVKSLMKFAHRLGKCATDGRGIVDGEKVVAYRDTRGVDVKTLKKLLAAPAQRYGSSLHGTRDTAILTLMIENALRRAEVCALDCGDFDPATKSLWILGKGKGTQKERVTLSSGCCGALAAYLGAFRAWSEQSGGETLAGGETALFRNCDRRPEFAGQRISADGLYALIGEYGKRVGLKRLTPHMLRHSSITAALDATKGDVRRVQKLSRHKNVATLQKYDDSREDMQGEVSNILSGLLGK